ncbi:unnamed protein product, partial [Staurois parvus]
MRGSYHPCMDFPGLYTRCAHYEGFPPFLCRAPGSVHPLCPLWGVSHHPCVDLPGLYTRCAHYEGFPTIPVLSSQVCTPAVP